MRKRAMIVLVLLSAIHLKGQTADEWFRQKKTQIKYLLEQIAADEVYIGYLQKGYKIAESGLNTINDIKHGDFNEHHDFFNSLKEVNPKIKNLSRVSDIISLQLQIIKILKLTIQQAQSSDQFTVSEITYMQYVFNHLLQECNKNINCLIMTITPGEAGMTDDERIQKIDVIYNGMQDKFSFCKSFSSEAVLLAMQRSQEQTDVEISKKLNGLTR